MVKDERGRGRKVGRTPYQMTRDKTESDREPLRAMPGAKGMERMDRGNTGRGDRHDNPRQRYSTGMQTRSSTGGKVGRGAMRRDRSREHEKP
jgi:hypothetical protein